MNNNSSGGFFKSFLLGLIIGGGVVFLFGTKRGKELIKSITEEGLEISELFSEDEDLEKEEINCNCKTCQDQKEVRQRRIGLWPKKPIKIQPEPKSKGDGNGGTLSKITNAPRRFFRGIPKRN